MELHSCHCLQMDRGACCPALLPLSLTRGWGRVYCWLLYWFSFLLFFYLLCFAGGAEHRGFAVSRHLSLAGSSHCPWLFLHWASWLASWVSKDWKGCQMLIEFLLSHRVPGSGIEGRPLGDSWEQWKCITIVTSGAPNISYMSWIFSGLLHLLPFAFGNYSIEDSPRLTTMLHFYSVLCSQVACGLRKKNPRRSQRCGLHCKLYWFSCGIRGKLISDSVPQPKLKRSDPGQEILQLLRRTLPFLVCSLEAGQYLISPG